MCNLEGRTITKVRVKTIFFWLKFSVNMIEQMPDYGLYLCFCAFVNCMPLAQKSTTTSTMHYTQRYIHEPIVKVPLLPSNAKKLSKYMLVIGHLSSYTLISYTLLLSVASNTDL